MTSLMRKDEWEESKETASRAGEQRGGREGSASDGLCHTQMRVRVRGTASLQFTVGRNEMLVTQDRRPLRWRGVRG